ncbi:MAG: MmcQ/YjbR family DNA-binding protein [Anaerolineae bacterium]|jgi:hypothetical protein|nr:MmcQ/YjbR family DNA-binding protein [Anaerolineae bacterium]
MSDYREAVKVALDDLLLKIPNVVGGKAFGYPAYKVAGKMFAFVGGKGIAFKLPRSRVEALLAEHPILHPFEPTEGTVWKEWISLDLDDPADYADYLYLLEEAIAYVAG